jgi:hypothetical protein
MVTKTRVHKKQNMHLRLRENLILIAVLIVISLWALLS